ncbi:NAD(P)-binding Rossmann-fold containing protein [Glarea lozoyensis ATCC 20868]|uniref:NAD(P)-binding Rossmann-fold containing protein n=1 Tax=Glarea lozoyensis (strain ATCC 20868 / MF5171) TaxID=1116229 RepID=S3E987_GLAL2|nr:NAD(P)-binding Rossmann-fold containing protein [Glarea lozoyensis ATCC 20868]EPE34833.1 NAD(P)-binding Rossmann-fold containing protein [Glarea lozoyensis ATCC 20868]
MDLTFFKSQFTTLPTPTFSFQNQTIIVTGANTGLGLEAARHFTNLGASKVILACRSLAKGEAACHNIEASTGRTGVCETWVLDMSNYDSIKAFTLRAEGLERLDVLVENAGIAKMEYEEVEGMESGVVVNVIGTMLLAVGMLPVLRKSAGKTGGVPRLVIVGSEVHGFSPLDERHEDSIFEACKKNDPKYMASRYPTTKLLLIFAIRALAAQMSTGPHASEPVIVNNPNPGLCHSELSRDSKGFGGFMFWLFRQLVARKTEVGSRTLVFAAAANEDSHGEYMCDCVVTPPSKFVRSEEGKKSQERVWTELVGILEGIQPGITKNI